MGCDTEAPQHAIENLLGIRNKGYETSVFPMTGRPGESTQSEMITKYGMQDLHLNMYLIKIK